ncbi:MAG: hypothetical protein SGARI_006125 [Bacillariaceae sp.]
MQDTTSPKKKRSSFTVHRIPEDDERPRARKSVTFQLDNESDNHTSDASHSHLPLQLTDELCAALWYGVEEIKSLKTEAKQVILKKDASADELLGLERFNQERATWKRSHIYYTLMAQKQNHGDEFVARVSKRCSGWAREKAIHQGFKDYCAVNDPLASLFGPNSENYNDRFFSDPGRTTGENSESKRNNNNNKRKSQEEATVSTPERNVRQRTAAPVEKEEEEDFDFEKVLSNVPVA